MQTFAARSWKQAIRRTLPPADPDESDYQLEGRAKGKGQCPLTSSRLPPSAEAR